MAIEKCILCHYGQSTPCRSTGIIINFDFIFNTSAPNDYLVTFKDIMSILVITDCIQNNKLTDKFNGWSYVNEERFIIFVIKEYNRKIVVFL